MKEWWKDYFSFTRKERTGAIVLSLLIVAVFIAPRFFDQYFDRPGKGELDRISKEFALEKPIGKKSGDENEEQEKTTRREKYMDEEHVVAATLFYFDPNTLSAEGWRKLGVKEKVVQTILHYIDKGGKFRQPDDLKRVYGLNPELADRLMVYVNILKPEFKNRYDKKETAFKNNEFLLRSENYKGDKKTPIDINLADTSAWIALPGIGSTLAGRIVRFREKLGGFYAVEQVGETFGLPDSTFQKIKDRLLISISAVKQININSAGLEEFRQHPYIRWKIAQALVRFREQHGPFKTINDIDQISIIDSAQLGKIKPYLTIN